MNTLGGSVIPILVITVLTLTIAKQSLAEELLCSDHDFYLEFPSNQPSVQIDGETDLEAFTICLWLSTSVASNLGIVRYSDQSTSDVLIGLSLSYNGHLYFSLGGEDRQLQVLPGVQAGDWHGLCVTWQKEDGFFMVYYDGRLLLTGSEFNTGNPVLSKGIFTLGIGSQNRLYEGRLGHVNAWPLALDHPHLAVLSSKCGVERGELVSWPEFREGTNDVSAVEGAACPLTDTDVTNELKHWRLDGSDEELSPQYSASFVEGRLDDHKAVYLDQTMAYLEAPFVNLSTTFTIACWVKLLPSNPYLKPILFSENNGSFWFGVDTDNKLLFENSIGASSLRVEVDDPLHEKQWLHVAVSLTTSSELIFYINGLKHLSAAAHSWQSPDNGPLAIGKVYSTSDGEYIYFHGFLSDLYVYSRALSAEEIGKIMGRSSPCTFSEWSSHPILTPGQKPTENRRAKSCPGVGQCTEVRAWKAADCREVLLAGNKISGIYTISPLNNEDEFDVFCDQETQGGGWTIIQQRNNGSVSFSKTWDEYKAGFGTVGGQSEMWLGNDKIHSLTTKNSELLIQLEAFDGSKGFSIYSDFHIAGESDKYRLSLGNFSGNLPNKLGTHSNFNFTVGTCADVPGVGWWFSSSCGEVLLNSQYGQNTGIMKWNDFPNLGNAGGKLMKTIMKIRRTEAYTGDYTLIFGKDAPSSSMVLWPTILTEFKAFTLCLWHKLYVQGKDKGRTMTLLRYFADDGNFTLIIKDFEDDDGPMLSLITWPSTEKQRAGVKFPAPDGSWHHLCVSWTNDGGVATAYLDGNRTSFLSTTGDGVTFSGGGRLVFGAVLVKDSKNLEGEVTHVNLWDKVLPEASIQRIAHSCQSETGNLLQWHFFAARAVGAVQYVPHASACFSKEMYHWNFHHSSTTQSIDLNKNHIAKLTEARISDYQKSLVIEDQGHFVAENISSDLSEDHGFTVSFSVRQTVMSSDILKDDFKSLEALRSAFPTFIRDYAMWKRCYSADHSSWNTAEFHSNCDSKGPSLTIIRVRQYVFGGFVEQSWGGTAQDIGHQFEGFLFSLSNPSGQSSQFFPIQLGKTSARTDPQFGPSFGQRDLELFQEESGRLMGFSRLGASFNVTNISLSSAETRNYFAGSQKFYPDQVEVFYYHVPSTPLGLEKQAIPDGNFNSSSVLNATTGPHLARLNELRDSRAWCSSGATASEWLQVFLGKQYTLTYIALQGIGGGYDVTALTVKYEQTQDGQNWITYSKLADGSETSKVLQFNLVSAGAEVKEAFFPPFQAVKLQIILTEQKVLCLKMELYFYDAGCSLAYGLEDGTIPDERLTASSVNDAKTNNKYWPLRGRLNNNAGSLVWGPYKRSGEFGTVGDWFQVDLEQEQEIKCIATQGRETHEQWLTNYQIEYSSEGNHWKFYEENNGEVKEFDANSDQHMAVTNWFVPSFYGRFIRVRVTGINNYCRLRMELYGKSANLTEIFSFQNGLAFTVRRGQYVIFFGKENSFWQIRHPLIVNQWFDATLTWTPDDGLKFFVNGKLVASDTTQEQLNLPLASEPFKLMIGLAENGGGWSRAISIDELKVWKMAMKEEEVKRKSEVYLDFEDNSRDWALLLNSSSGWKLSHGCTETAWTGPCDDVSGGGRYIHFDASQPEESARFVTPSNVNLYTCLKFYYHMAGAHIGRLNIYSTGLYGNEELLWRLYGNQNNTWNEAHIPVNVNHPQYQVIFEAVKGSSYLGDIAIDQIKFTREECSLFPSSAAPQDVAGSGIVIDSSIAPVNSVYHQYLSLMLAEEGHDSSRWTPCYRALDHGWSVSTFHQKCDNISPTLSMVRKENFVFGGFTERSWGEGQQSINPSYDLHFWRQSRDDYVRSSNSSASSMTSFTVSFWIMSSLQNFQIAFSFTSTEVAVEFEINNSGAPGICFVLDNDQAAANCSYIDSPPSKLNDGFWHQIVAVWSGINKSWIASIDGVSQEWQSHPAWTTDSIPTGGTLMIGQLPPSLSTDSSKSFLGRITLFNMWDHTREASELAMLARGCRNDPGNLFSWNTLKSSASYGQLKIIEPSSCCSTYYRSDNKAFIFSLNYTSEGSLFKKKISDQYAATAIYSSPSTGPTFGQAPFDFQIGDSDNMKTGSSHHVISYEGGGSNAGTNLETVLAGASTFEPSDVEVLYKVHGASLCPQHCPFNHHCDEINGGCRCNTEDEDPALCQIFQLYKDSSHFWPLDSVEEIKDLATPGWGKANGGVSEVFGMTTDGVSGEIHLNHEGDTCATKTANYSCGDAGFTVSLFIKPENRADGLQQTFFKSLGKFVVYQEANSKSLIVRVQRATEYCLKEIAMPEKIWSHLAFTYDASAPQTLTVYRNGQRIDKFIRDEGCNKAGIPEFSSSSVLLGGGDFVHAKASYLHIAIWKQVLPEERIAQLFHATKYLVPFSVQVVAQIENIPWHEDLTSPETERYTLTTNDIKSNVTGFYSNFSGILISVEVNGYWSGSVVAAFTITFNDSNFDLIQELNASVSSTGYLYNMPLKIQQLTPRNVPYESPANLSVASVSDTYLDITWDDPSLPLEIWNIFQGYEVYIRRHGTTQFNVTQINEQVNFITLSGLEPLVTYEMSIAAYTLTGVGKRSDIISVNTTFVAPPENISVISVTYSCVTMQWNDVAPERFGLFVGYVVHYDFFYQSSFSMYKQTSPASIHEVEICGLQPSSTYKFYVRRELLESKLGNGSAIQLFTTLKAPIRVPPTNVTAYNTSSTSIMVQWQSPAIPVGVQLSGYQVFFKPRLNATAQWGSKITCNSTFNVTLKSLQKYTDYEIMVSAFNSLGLGNFSEVATSFTDEDIPLSGPVMISANYTSSTSINISWSPVPEPLRLGIIIKYIFNLTDILTGVVTTAEFDGANLHGEATNLSKYREYSITGAVANSKGQSNFTSTVTCRTDEDAPDFPPANVTAYNASSTEITVEFQAYSPEQLNGILRKYVFRIFKANDVNSPHWIYTFPLHRSRRRRAASRNSVIQNTLLWLEEYTVYSIQASVFTNKQGPYSAVLNVSTDEGVPRAPPLQLTAFNTSNSSILATWEDITSSSVPGILLGYVLRIVKADDSNASNFREIEHDLSTSKNITNLETYTLYKISVAGYTRVGIGNFSEAQSWTDEGVPLGPPNNLTRSSTSTNSITLSWIPVKKELRKGIIQGHEAKIFNDNGVLLDGTTVYGSGLSAYFDGLNVYSNYTVQVRAFTRKGFGPWSPLVRVTTGAPVPEQTPKNATARATGSYTIHVTWGAISVIDAWSLFGYRVLYFPISNPGQLRDIITSRDEIQATITGLRPFTLYGIQIAAYSTEDGNYTTPVYAQTWQAAPSAPPSRFGVTALDSQSLLVYWLDVPPEHRNGIIRGYRIAYRSSSNGTTTVITRRAYSELLTQLQKATEYTIQVWAFTDAGDGIPASYTTWTDEDVPSRPPSNITAQNRTSLTSIPIFWEPFSQEYTHGRLVGYRVTYQAVSIGDLPVEFEPLITKDVGNAITSMTLRNLKPLVVYRITVAAISNKGPGPAGITFGETCRCRPHLTTNWRNYPPYVNVTFLSTPGIIIPKLLTGVISECCGECLDHGQSKLDFTRNGNNGTAQQNSSEDLLQNIDGQTDFSFPVIGYKLQDSYKGGLGYAPFVESAGIAFVVYTDNSGVKDAMFDALIACWPVVVLPVVMAYIAGVLVWLLDAKSNSQHFPTSFVHGTWEGIWWSFVSMTTVGYGDRTPMSHLGRIFAVGWVLVGLVIIAVTMGALTTALTTITSVSETRIYGSRIGAIQGSPEYNLGVRRNALMNEAKHYHTLEDLSEALLNREVDGILIDSYAGGTQRDLFSKPSVRVARVIDHQTAYGVVIGGDSMRLRHCFYGYMRSHQADIFKWVEQLVEPIKGSGLSDEEIVQDISTGLFDSNADLFHSTLLITSTCAVTGVVLGLVYEVVRRIRARQKVQHENTLLTDKDKIVEEMRLIMDEFFQQTIKSLKKMKAKHKKELLKYVKSAPARSEKRTSMLTNSSFINSRNNLNEDDISVIELEDLRLNSTKC